MLMVKSIRDIEEKIENDMIQRFEARVEWCLITKMNAMVFMETYGSGTVQNYFRDNYGVQEALVYSSKDDQDSKPFNSMYDWLKIIQIMCTKLDIPSIQVKNLMKKAN